MAKLGNPEFSKLHAIKDGILVCSKKEGTIELFKYIPLEDVRLGDLSLGEVLENKDQKINKLEKRIKELERKIQIIIKLQGLTINEGDTI